MKAEIVVTFDGISREELKDALQGLRNVEQENPERIAMFAMVTAPELTTEDVLDLLKRLNPPMDTIKVINKTTSLMSNREIHQGSTEQEGGNS